MHENTIREYDVTAKEDENNRINGQRATSLRPTTRVTSIRCRKLTVSGKFVAVLPEGGHGSGGEQN